MHKWRKNMLVKEYHRKYLNDIREQKPLSREELLEQIKSDYVVLDKSDIEYARENINEVNNRVHELIKNRMYEERQHIRIATEYYWRNRIAYFFPSAHKAFLHRWELEKMKELLSLPAYQEFMKHAKEWMTGKKEKPKSLVEDTFGGLITKTK